MKDYDFLEDYPPNDRYSCAKDWSIESGNYRTRLNLEGRDEGLFSTEKGMEVGLSERKPL